MMRFMRAQAFLLTLLFAVFLFPAEKSSAEPASGAAREITVNASAEKGVFSDYLFGTMSGPVFNERAFSLANEGGFKLIEIKIDIDDMGPAKLENFEKSLKAVFRAKAHPLVWLLVVRARPSDVASNTEKVLKLLRDVDPKYPYVIRVGNEPDNRAFWRGTKREFFDIYAGIASAVKKFDRRYAVGGMALMNGCSEDFASSSFDCGRYNDWLTDFLEYARTNQVPVDFLTVHAYSALGYKAFYQQFKKVSELLKKYQGLSPLYGTPKLGNDEWNIMVGDVWSGSYKKQFNTAWTAASNVIAWIAMVENDLWLSVRYGGTANDFMAGGDPTFGHDFPLVHADGTKKPVFFALQALNSLAGTRRLEVTGNDYVNSAAVAGKAADGSITVVLSNFDMDSYLRAYPDRHPKKILQREYAEVLKNLKRQPDRFDNYKLNISNPSWKAGDRLSCEVFMVDDSTGALRLIETRDVSVGEKTALTGKLSAPAVYLFKIRKN